MAWITIKFKSKSPRLEWEEIVPKEAYLGDGVYASFDGYHIVLDLRAQGPDRICLEPAVLNALFEFANSLKETKQND